jgi:carboxymethylenebutenolidase
MGFCYGGHLAIRAAGICGACAAAAFYPTGLVSGVEGRLSDTLSRLSLVTGELAVFVGSEDSLLPPEDRLKILSSLAAAGVRHRWHEVPAGHGFMRDGGPDYDPELSRLGYAEVVSLFRRN